MKKLRKSKSLATLEEKPPVVKTHLRDMIIVPEMIGAIVGVHQGKTFNQVEIKVPQYYTFFALILMTLHGFSLKWLVTTWVSFPLPISPLSTVVPVLVLPILLASFLLSKDLLCPKLKHT